MFGFIKSKDCADTQSMQRRLVSTTQDEPTKEDESCQLSLAGLLWWTWYQIGIPKEQALRDLEEFQASVQVKDFIRKELDRFYEKNPGPTEGRDAI